MKYQLKINGKIYQIEHKQDGYYCDSKKMSAVDFTRNKLVDFKQVPLEDGFHFKIDGKYFKAELEKENQGSIQTKEGSGLVISPMNGMIYSVDCQINSKVKKGDKLLTIEAMKMLYPIFADKDGKILKCELKKGTAIKSNQVLIKIE